MEDAVKDLHPNFPRNFRSFDDDDDLQPCARHLKQEGSCEGFVCPKEHSVLPFGVGLWQVNSVKIHRNMQHPDSEVRIHGAIRRFYAGRWADFGFEHSKDPLVFEIPADETLTLPLKDPSLLSLFRDDSSFPSMLVILLKYNDASIFGRLSPEPTSKLLESCADLFGEEDCNNLGHAATLVVSQGRKVERWVFGDGVVSPEVASVEVELESVVAGYLGVVKFITASSRLTLHGKITARSCLRDSGIVLFEKNENERVPVESNGSIPLSRQMTIVDSQTSLILEARLRLRDVNGSDSFVVNETVLFAPPIPDTTISSATMANGAIKVEVKWIVPYSLSDFTRC